MVSTGILRERENTVRYSSWKPKVGRELHMLLLIG
jgi:hypothetical protein